MSPVVSVLPGQRFGRLTVVSEAPRKASRRRPRGIRVFRCRCACGEIRDVLLGNLTCGRTLSCGCLMAEIRRSRENVARLNMNGGQSSVTHGLRSHPLYGTWHNMMQRCHYVAGRGYGSYGGRGITVCAEWHDVREFVTWIELNIGPRPAGLSLDRIDNDGSYEPGNVRWADAFTQRANQRPRLAVTS